MQVVDYDPAWAETFARERETLDGALEPWLEGGIHHIGSTSVPGLRAKPIVDMLAGVRSLEESRAAFAVLAELGYEWQPHRPEAHRFGKPGFHLHLTEPGSDLWRERLAFRAALRASPALRDEYAAWKDQHYIGGERVYDAGKRPLVLRVLAEQGIELRPDAQRLDRRVKRPLPFPEPPLSGDGFVLRRFAERDVEADHAAMSHESSVPWLNEPPAGTPAEVAAALERERLDGLTLALTIADADSDDYLGAIVLLTKDRGTGELAYLVAPNARGRGLARRAVALVGDWAFAWLGLPRLQLRIDPENTASIRVAEACGYSFEGVLRSAFEVRGRRIDIGMWSRLPGD